MSRAQGYEREDGARGIGGDLRGGEEREEGGVVGVQDEVVDGEEGDGALLAEGEWRVTVDSEHVGRAGGGGDVVHKDLEPPWEGRSPVLWFRRLVRLRKYRRRCGFGGKVKTYVGVLKGRRSRMYSTGIPARREYVSRREDMSNYPALVGGRAGKGAATFPVLRLYLAARRMRGLLVYWYYG
jgi:hypothetical protein